jgi:hypothetical protein
MGMSIPDDYTRPIEQQARTERSCENAEPIDTSKSRNDNDQTADDLRPAQQRATVLQNSLSVMYVPSRSTHEIGRLNAGDSVTVVEYRMVHGYSWSSVQLSDGRIGWVSSLALKAEATTLTGILDYSKPVSTTTQPLSDTRLGGPVERAYQEPKSGPAIAGAGFCSRPNSWDAHQRRLGLIAVAVALAVVVAGIVVGNAQRQSSPGSATMSGGVNSSAEDGNAAISWSPQAVYLFNSTGLFGVGSTDGPWYQGSLAGLPYSAKMSVRDWTHDPQAEIFPNQVEIDWWAISARGTIAPPDCSQLLVRLSSGVVDQAQALRLRDVSGPETSAGTVDRGGVTEQSFLTSCMLAHPLSVGGTVLGVRWTPRSTNGIEGAPVVWAEGGYE